MVRQLIYLGLLLHRSAPRQARRSECQVVVESSLKVFSPALQNLVQRVTRRSVGFVDGWCKLYRFHAIDLFNGFKGWTHAVMGKTLLDIIEDAG